MAEPKDVEILVHIAAPSRASDDARYRALASAYINFQSAGQPRLSNSSQYQKTGGIAVSDGIQSRKGKNLSEAFLQPSQASSYYLGSLRSPEASFESALDNANSPTPLKRPLQIVQPGAPNSQVQESQSSWKSPPSVVQDSHPHDRIIAAAYSSPTRVLEHYLQTFEHSSQSTNSNSNNGSKNNISYAITENPEKCRLNQTARENCPTGIIPCTPISKLQVISKTAFKLGEEEPEKTPSRSQESEDEVIDETFIDSSTVAEAVINADSEPSPTKKKKTAAAVAPGPRGLLRTASNIGPGSSTETLSLTSTISFLPEHGYTFENLEVHAPDHPTSVAHIDAKSLITSTLAKLAHHLEIPKRFRPQQQKRELRPLERGYWLLDCSSWDQRLKRDGWAYLVNYIAAGKAGWGIWCSRDSDFRSLRIYCWGVVVPHIYLLAYLASQRKVLYTGCSWIDGDQEAVLLMGARDYEH